MILHNISRKNTFVYGVANNRFLFYFLFGNRLVLDIHLILAV
jgi:hypothetical protein